MGTLSPEEAARRIARHRRVQAVVLFGSRARGTSRQDSDTDLCVLADRRLPQAAREDVLAEGGPELDVSLFWDLPPAIRYRVVSEGRALFVRDELALHRARTSTVREYLDLRPLLERHRRRLMGEAR